MFNLSPLPPSLSLSLPFIYSELGHAVVERFSDCELGIMIAVAAFVGMIIGVLLFVWYRYRRRNAPPRLPIQDYSLPDGLPSTLGITRRQRLQETSYDTSTQSEYVDTAHEELNGDLGTSLERDVPNASIPIELPPPLATSTANSSMLDSYGDNSTSFLLPPPAFPPPALPRRPLRSLPLPLPEDVFEETYGRREI